MKNSVVWDMTPCGSCKNRRFGGTYRLRHQDEKISELGKTFAVSSTRTVHIVIRLPVTDNIVLSSLILSTLMMQTIRSSETALFPFLFQYEFIKQQRSMKNGVFWDFTPCGSCKNRLSKERSTSFIRATRSGELGTLSVTGNRRTIRRFLQEPHGVTSQKKPFFIVTALKTANLKY
jgi:hypothetical protein